MPVRFAHLSVHSEYSLLDSLIRLKPLLQNCYDREIPAVALTDACNLFAAVKFYKVALAKGIKPIFGCDLMIEAEDSQHYELTLLAETDEGYQSIVELISSAYLEAERQSGIPVIPKARLGLFNLKEVIILSGALHGELGKALLTRDTEEAGKVAESYYRLCGKGNFFIELRRLGEADEENYIHEARKFAEHSGIALVATNPVRFIDETDFDDHEVRVGIYEGYTLLDESRKSLYTPKQYLKSADEMCALFSDIPESLEATVHIAERCNVRFKLGSAVLPNFAIPEGISETDYFSEVSLKGLDARLKVILLNKSESEKPEICKLYQQRLQREISVICQMGFAGYFLIVADFIHWSKKNQIPVGPGRGSGAGSLVAFALEITDIDPIPYGLLFERFLNPERVSMPDFDIDFCIDGRDQVIEYVGQKYGEQSVSQIITYGSMAAKAVVRDVGRVLGQPYGFVDKIAKMIPNDLGITLKDATAKGTPLYDYAKEDEVVDSILKTAFKLENLARNVGKHAAGVVIAPSKVTDFSPIYCEEGSRQLVTQFDKKDIEEVGLVKFDFLGLRNLTIIDNTLKIINDKRLQKKETAFDISRIAMNDKATFALLQKGDTTGVFQLESRGMKELIKRLKPDCFEDIIALVALYRPGPLGSGMVDDFVNRKHGRQKVHYPHPDLKEVLKETYGTILYQEQVMQIAQILANYSLGSADILRRAMGKKDPKEMAKQRETFEKGAAKNGVDPTLASTIFDLMEEFAKYGFNKSHSAAYALISYQTAFLKAHYPEAFMAAVLSSDIDNTDKVVNFIRECRKMKLPLKSPDINKGNYDFTVNEKNEIIYGLGAIKGVGQAAIDLIVEERKKQGAYKDLYDFCRRLDLRKVNKRVCEALVVSGACDQFATERARLFYEIDAAMKSAEQMLHMKDSGQVDLFGFEPAASAKPQDKAIDTNSWSDKEKLIREKSSLGLTLSGHLIDEDRLWLNLLNTTPLNRITVGKKRQSILLAGVVVSISQRKTKSGKTMGLLQLDDGFDRLELVIFSELFDQVKGNLRADETVIVTGEAGIDNYNDQLRINAIDIQPITLYVNTHISGLQLKLPVDALADFSHTLEQFGQDKKTDTEKLPLRKYIEIMLASTEFEAKLHAKPTFTCFYAFVNALSKAVELKNKLCLIKGKSEFHAECPAR